jgi:hypothetical protein
MTPNGEMSDLTSLNAFVTAFAAHIAAERREVESLTPR